MSKKVDVSDLSKLSDEDIQYALDRGMITVDDIPKGKKVKTQPGDSTSVSTDDAGDGLDEMSASQLKEEAEKRELPKGGSKQDLIERIREHDAASDNSGDAGDDDTLEED